MGYIYAINISIKFVSNRVWWRCSKNKITHLIHGFYTHFHRYTFSNKILLIIFFWILFSLGVKYLFESYFPPSQSPQSLYSILNYFSLHLYPSPPPPPHYVEVIFNHNIRPYFAHWFLVQNFSACFNVASSRHVHEQLDISFSYEDLRLTFIRF